MATPLFSRLPGFARNPRTAPQLSGAQAARLADWRRLPQADLECRHERCRYVVVDVETTGLDLKRDALIAIGAVAIEGGAIDLEDAFEVVLRQDEVSSDANILIHGIGASAQREGVDAAEALLAFLGYAGNAPLVAYHAFFDRTMIEKAMERALGTGISLPWIDLAWVMPNYYPSRADALEPLDDWLARFAITSIRRHNALSDAYASAQLLQLALAEAGRRGDTTPKSLVAAEKTQRWFKRRN
jgi:DNA polymerase-3 subunit epsilon